MSTATPSAFSRPVSDWGTSLEMTALEAMMWRAEADPLLRSHGVVAELLDLTPAWERLVEGHAWATRRVPRLRQRVIDDPTHLGMPVWAETNVDLSYHLRRTSVPPGGGLEDALDIASALHMSAFDPARPLWEAVLVEGLPAGQALYLLKVHHSLADGTGFIQLFDLLHSDRREPTADKPDGPDALQTPPDALSLAARHASDGVRGAAGAAARLTRGGLTSLARAAADPTGTLDYARSLGRVTGASPGTPSPLMAERSLSRRLRTLDVSVAELRAAGKAAGCSLNDAFLSALSGGLGRYHAAAGVPVTDLPIALPVSLRASGDETGGNRFAGARIAAPAGEPDPIARMKLIRERVLAARDEPALDFMGMTAPVMSRVPVPVLTRLTASFTRSLDLQASNFPGLQRESYVAGARVLRWYPFGPAPGCPVMATLASHEGVCCIGFTIDSAAITDVDGFMAAMEAAMSEVVAVGA